MLWVGWVKNPIDVEKEDGCEALEVRAASDVGVERCEATRCRGSASSTLTGCSGYGFRVGCR